MRRPILAASISLATLSIFMVSGVLLANSYYAQFNVSTSTVSAILPSLASHTAPFDVTLDSSYLVEGSGPGEAEYWITGTQKCLLYEGFDCVEFTPDLCNYLSITSTTDTEETEYTQFLVGNDWYKVAQGVLVFEDHVFSHPNDLSDGWSVAIHAPCFEGECPVGYDAGIHGTPLPQSLKGQTFTCDLNVDTGYFPISLRNILAPERVYAQSEVNQHIIEVSAVFSGVEETPACTENCNSNVMFLPGLEASRLYRNSGVFGETRIWDPPLIRSNEYLFMNPDGTPINPEIYTKDVIDESYGANVYKNFLSSMDSLVSDNYIAGWETLPYDWRNDVYDVVNNPINLQYSSYSMVDEVIRMASSSRTGKVTLIAHSNGGLVGKVLIQKLVDMGRGDLVDKFIMVGVPQLGTPKAVNSLLHGDGLPMDNLPLLISKGDARTLGENMPSGYSLLPSEEYLSRVLDPVVIFDSGSVLTASYAEKYGTAITTPSELRDFLITGVGSKPTSSDFYTPNKLNTALYDGAVTNHTKLDSWQAPTSTEVIQIAGWGLDTPSGVRYFENSFESVGCVSNCAFLDHNLIFTNDGDGTVVSPSAVVSATATTYYLDIRSANAGLTRNRDHMDILEDIYLQDLIQRILTQGVGLPENISQSIPPPESGDKTLRLKVHSPVTLDVYDDTGRHTGISTSTQSENGRVIDRQIPNSYYLEVGEGKYAGVSILGPTTIKLFGTGVGTFTLEVEELSGGVVVGSTTFSGIPVSTSSVGVIDLGLLTSVASSTLALDVDGDGQSDAVITPGVGLSPSEMIGLLRGAVKAIDLPAKKEEKLLKKVDKLDIVLQKEFKKEMKKKIRIALITTRMTAYIQKLEHKNLLTEEDVTDLLNLIGQISNVGVK